MAELEDTAELPVPDADQVSRFIHEKEWFYKETGKPKVSAFLPMYVEQFARWETSLCHLHDCPDDRVWELARSCRAGKTLYGRVDFAAEHARSTSLECLKSPDGDFVEHAVLVHWPSDKLAQKEIARNLARACPTLSHPPLVQ